MVSNAAFQTQKKRRTAIHGKLPQDIYLKIPNLRFPENKVYHANARIDIVFRSHMGLDLRVSKVSIVSPRP